MEPLTKARLKNPLLRRYGSIAAIALFLIAAPAWAQQAGGEQMHARISYSEGDGMVKGADDSDWSFATVNTLVLPGDTVWADRTGTMELEMAGGTFLRLADGTKAEIVSLPMNGAIRAWEGSFYVQRIQRSRGDFVFTTPVADIGVNIDTDVRIDILTSGATTVSVRWGEAVIRANGDQIAVREGQRSYIDPGLLPSEPVPFDKNEEDAFDAWNRERARLLAVGEDAIPAEIPAGTAPIGVSDLAAYGNWIYVDNEPYWQPTVIVDYVPYRYGYWSYVPAYGHCWIGHHPFAYVTSHYGRWHYDGGHGWLWSYRDVWGPAWVASVRYGSNFVWAPLDPWDRPVYWGDDFFMVGGARFGVWASSYCPVNDFLYYGAPTVFVRPCHRDIFHGVPRNEINIWNININVNVNNRHDFYRRVYGDVDLAVRDYHPRRVIRGPEKLEGVSYRPRERVAELEREVGRDRFIPAGAEQRRETRTAVDIGGRQARMRSARVEPDAMRDVADRATLLADKAQNPEVRQRAHEVAQDARQTAERIPAERPGRAAREARQPAEGAPGSVRMPRATTEPGAVAERPGRERAEAPKTAPGVEAERGHGRTPGAEATAPGAEAAPGATAERGRTRTEARGRTEAPGAEATAPGATAERGRTRTEARGRTEAPGAEATAPGATAERGRTRTETRGRTEAPGKEAAPGPVDRSRGPAEVRGRTEAPKVTAPSPGTVDRGRGRADVRQRSEAPSAPSDIVRTVPRERAAVPQVQRPEPRISPQASAPEITRPERTMPQVQRPEPRVQAAPRMAPQATMPERAAPQAMPQRIQPERQYSAPRAAPEVRMPSPQPQVSAPAAPSRPTVSAPRDFGGGREMSSPRVGGGGRDISGIRGGGGGGGHGRGR